MQNPLSNWTFQATSGKVLVPPLPEKHDTAMVRSDCNDLAAPEPASLNARALKLMAEALAILDSQGELTAACHLCMAMDLLRASQPVSVHSWPDPAALA